MQVSIRGKMYAFLALQVILDVDLEASEMSPLVVYKVLLLGKQACQCKGKGCQAGCNTYPLPSPTLIQSYYRMLRRLDIYLATPCLYSLSACTETR